MLSHPWILAALLSPAAPVPEGHASTASHIGGPFVQIESGLTLCGARGSADCGKAGPGFAFGLRGGWRPIAYLSVEADAQYSGLPAKGSQTGRWLYVGPGLRGLLPLGDFTLSMGAGLGFGRISGPNGAISGFGALRLLGQATYTLADRFPVGLGFTYTRPRSGENCHGDACIDVQPAALLQILVVAGAAF